MRLTRIDIEAFGCLSDFTVELAPGLHVFFGPNEAGKSTLQQAILALLYGFYASENVKRRETALHDRFRPWSDGRYTGRLEYCLQDGREFRVHRDFSNTDVSTTVWDLAVGRDVTDEFGRGRRGNVPFMVRQIGMPKAVFETCAFVLQGEVFEIAGEHRASPQEIGDTIVSLADTGRRDVSAQRAIERLEKVLREQVGTDRARTTPLPVTRNRLREAQRELEEVTAAQAEVAREAQELHEAEAATRRLRDDARRTRYLLAVVEATELRKRISGLRELDAEESSAQERLTDSSGFATFPVEERDRILQAAARVADLNRRVNERAGSIERQKEQLAELAKQREALAGQRAGLGPVDERLAHRKGEIDGLVGEWRSAEAIAREARSRCEAAAAGAEHLVAECDGLEREVGSLTPADRQRLLAELQAPDRGQSARMFARIGRGLVWLLLALPRLVVWLASRLRAANVAREDASAVTGIPAGDPADLLQKHGRYQEIVPLVRKLREERGTAEASERALQTAEAKALAALTGFVDTGIGLRAAYEAFSRRIEVSAEARVSESRAQALEAEWKAVAAALREHEEDIERASALERGVVDALAALLGRRGELAELQEAFEAACRGREAHDAAKRDLAGLVGQRAALLGRYSAGELEQMLANRERDIESILREAPHLEGAQTAEKAQVLREQREREAQELGDLDVRIAHLGTAIDSRLRGLRPRAELEEEIERLRQEAESLDRFGRGLAAAIESAKEAMREAHRNFAPSVGSLLSEGLERVTGGRYVRAFLDPSTFKVTTEVPETGRLEDVDSLSQGTRAAAYVLLRVGLAQHMSTMGEPVPIILDDPLVDLDDVRQERFLEVLAGLAREAQILLFTKDEATREWFNRECAGRPGHRLTEMGRTGAAAAFPPALL